MASLGVLNYNLPPGLTMKLNTLGNENATPLNSSSSIKSGNILNTKTFNKITVQNVLSENSSINSLNIANANPNAIVRKIKDFGMIGSVNNAAGAVSLNMSSRKRPLKDSNSVKPKEKLSTENKPAANKKPKLSKEERAVLRAAKKSAKENGQQHGKVKGNAVIKPQATLLQQFQAGQLVIKVPGTPGRKGLPLPQAVARRNARERNRVKQVNNGFAALRERIPEEVAEAFEVQHQSKSNAAKKLSKVETLRMAVEYIRSLERLLGFDFPINTDRNLSMSSGEDSFTLIKDEFDDLSPSMDEQYDDSMSHYDSEEYFNSSLPAPLPGHDASAQFSSPQYAINQMDMLPNITTLNGLQYIRIPGTNTYQLLTPDIFVGSSASPPSSSVDEEHFNSFMDSNCVSPSSVMSSVAAPADLNASTPTSSPPTSSPPSSLLSSAISSSQRLSIFNSQIKHESIAAPATNVNNEGSTAASLLSSSKLSPVPQMQQGNTSSLLPLSSPAAENINKTTTKLHHQQQQQQQQQPQITSILSPAATNNQQEIHHQRQGNTGQLQQTQQFLPALAATSPNERQLQQEQQQQQQQLQQPLTTILIKQEFDEIPNSTCNVLYQNRISPNQQQQQQQQLYLQHNNVLAMSPPLERKSPQATSSSVSAAHLPQQHQHFFENHHTQYYTAEAVNMKKEFSDVLLDASHTNAVLSDESMIEAIDWWEAHTPKSDGGSVLL